MELNYFFVFLIVLIYLPIFLFSFFFNFKKRFMRIDSMNYFHFFVEVLVGFNYFFIFIFSLFVGFSLNVFFYFGMIFYLFFLILTYFGYYSFFVCSKNGLVSCFPYSVSRNPTYFFSLLAIIGVSLASFSYILFFLVFVQFVLTHFIILNEEGFCEKKYGKRYFEYKKKVRRYI